MKPVGDCTEQVFKMYGGEPVEVELEFSDQLIGVVYDKFGEGTPMERLNEATCRTTVTVQISPTFWGWLSQFAGKMRIVSPDFVREDCLGHIREV